MTPLLFLPGAGGSARFWQPVAARLPAGGEKDFVAWPGLGDEPPDPSIASFDDLVALARRRLETLAASGPVDLVAQSMGGVVAARLALDAPQHLRRLVLCATSGGVDMEGLGAADWRADYRRSYPAAASWITEPGAAAALEVERISAPTLLLWGDTDPISPVAVGRHLAARLPRARLEIVKGGAHDLAITHAAEASRLIGGWLDRDPQ